MNRLSLRSLLFWIVLSNMTGCESCDRMFETEREQERREEVEREVAEMQAGLDGDLEKFLVAKSCPGCAFVIDVANGTDFRESVLNESRIRCQSCEGIDFRNSDLRKAGISGRLDGIDLRGSKVEDISFGGATSMKGARMDGLDLREIFAAERIDWSGAILRGAKLDGVYFMGPGGRHGRSIPVIVR